MPLYPFACAQCAGEHSLLRTIANRSQPATCPSCGGVMRRQVCAPHLAVMNPAQRLAASTDERSRHEPRVGCCGGGSGKNTVKLHTPLGEVKAPKKRGTRPWMLGH